MRPWTEVMSTLLTEEKSRIMERRTGRRFSDSVEVFFGPGSHQRRSCYGLADGRFFKKEGAFTDVFSMVVSLPGRVYAPMCSYRSSTCCAWLV